MIRNSNFNRFDAASPCLVLAPHLEYPLRKGADILIDKKWAQFSKYVPFVDIVGKNVTKRYLDAKLVKSTSHVSTQVSSARAAIFTLIKRSHYMLEKNLTKNYMKIGKRYLSDPRYKTVVFSHTSTAAILDEVPEVEDRLYCIETIDDELKWFRNLREYSINPLAKLVAYFSERWVRSFLSEHESDFLFIHVSEADQRGYLEHFPNHKSYVVPIGVDEVPMEAFQQEGSMPSDKVRLIFVGALSVKINADAIMFFEDEFYPLLKETLGEGLEVLVVGSNPSKGIIRACKRRGWKLYPDVSDRELKHLYAISLFSILPFRYTTGSKLKLLNSLAHGTPYLATSVLCDQAQKVIYPCLISDNPEEWLHRILEVRRGGMTNEERAALANFANKHSWASIAHYMFRLLSVG